MKIPKIFIPDNKSVDEKLKELEIGKPYNIKQVKDILSLSCIPEETGTYALRTDFKMIKKKEWAWHFGEKIPKYIIRAGEMTYTILLLSSVYTSIYLLEFKSGTDLNKLNRKIKLEKEINQIEAMQTKCLKKDNYLVAIKTNHTDKCGLDVFGNWYINNFGLEGL